MALNQVQQIALELLKSKDITVKEAYTLASEFLNNTDYIDEAVPLEVEVNVVAAMSGFGQWYIDISCKALDISLVVSDKGEKERVINIAKQRIVAAIESKLADSGKKIGQIKYVNLNAI